MIAAIARMKTAAAAFKAASFAVGRAIFAPRYVVIERASGGKVHKGTFRSVYEARRFATLLNWQHGHNGLFRAVYA